MSLYFVVEILRNVAVVSRSTRNHSVFSKILLHIYSFDRHRPLFCFILDLRCLLSSSSRPPSAVCRLHVYPFSKTWLLVLGKGPLLDNIRLHLANKMLRTTGAARTTPGGSLKATGARWRLWTKKTLLTSSTRSAMTPVFAMDTPSQFSGEGRT